MPELTTSGFILFLLICGEMVLFFVMNGADFGAGISTAFVKNKGICGDIMRVPWPVWFGNETWFVVAMGTMFGTFPHWYAGLASGWYPVFLLALVGLILRGTAFDCRLKWRQKLLNGWWNGALVIGSVLPPFLIGMVFSSALQGAPIVNGVVEAGFIDVVTPFTVISGIVLVLLCMDVGIARVLKFIDTGSELGRLLRKRLMQVQGILLIAIVAEAALLFAYTDVFSRHPAAITVLALCLFASVAASFLLAAKRRDRLNFWVACVSVASFVILIFWGMFPYAIVGTAGNSSLSLAAAAAGPESQKWGLAGSLVVLPLLGIGQGVSYYLVNKYYTVPDTDINY